MTNKLTDKDKKDWQNFLNSSEKLHAKDLDQTDNQKITEKLIDLHGYTLEEANKEISRFKQDLQIHNCLTLEKATKLAFKKATISNFKNNVILFSPSAASFDQYKNFEDRGNKFKEIVNQQLSESLIK